MKLYTVQITTTDEDLDTEILFALGAQSISCASGVLTAIMPEESLPDVRSEFATRAAIDELPDKDWVNLWSESFHGIILTENTAVVRDQSFGKKHEIRISPENAFGAGTHPTTALSVKLIEDLFAKGSVDSVLDIGCGTGILAIAASVFGAMSVEGFDIDEKAVINAEKNAALNDVPVNFFVSSIEDFSPDREYDLICANLHTSLIEKSFPVIASCCAVNGSIILSGIIENWYALVEDIIERNGFKIDECLQRDGWMAYLLSRI